ncbi:hypothetical protein EBI01_16635 [Marinomonas rhizomae]|nr:hypothetical protein EBI01_16635 [Marinomonas rhizomae]
MNLLGFYCSDQIKSDLSQGGQSENTYTHPFQINDGEESAPSLICLSGCSLDRACYEVSSE